MAESCAFTPRTRSDVRRGVENILELTASPAVDVRAPASWKVGRGWGERMREMRERKRERERERMLKGERRKEKWNA